MFNSISQLNKFNLLDSLKQLFASKLQCDHYSSHYIWDIKILLLYAISKNVIVPDYCLYKITNKAS